MTAMKKQKRRKAIRENGPEMAKAKRPRKEMELKESACDTVQPNSSSAVKEPFRIDRLRAFRYCIDKEKHSAVRNLFFKGDASNPNSLIIANIPSFISTDSIKLIIERYLSDDNVKEVIVQRSTSTAKDLNEGYRTMSACLESEYDVEKALERCESTPIVCLAELGIEPLTCGVAKFCQQYRKKYLPSDKLQEQVDSFLNEHDAKVLEKKRLARKMRNVPDAEGWITVTKTRHLPTSAAVVVKNEEDILRLSKKKKKDENNLAFYSFQLKQSKAQRLEELRRKFEEDKKKIALAKAARKFRPV